MRTKGTFDAHQNLRRCASNWAEMRRVSRSPAEAIPFPSASLPILFGFSAIFVGYLPARLCSAQGDGITIISTRKRDGGIQRRRGSAVARCQSKSGVRLSERIWTNAATETSEANVAARNLRQSACSAPNAKTRRGDGAPWEAQNRLTTRAEKYGIIRVA